MTKYTLTFNPKNINFAPATVLEEVYQNINTILNTYRFSVPLFREFGLKSEFIDKPMNLLTPIYVKEIVETVEKFEPRVTVEEVKMKAEMDGKVYPTIIFTLRSGVIT